MRATLLHLLLLSVTGVATFGTSTRFHQASKPGSVSHASSPTRAAPIFAWQQRAASSENDEPLLFGVPKNTVAEPLGLLLFAQFVLFIGVGAVIPVMPLYGKAIGLSGATNGIILGAPALALLIGAQPAGRFADAARKRAMLVGMCIIAVSDLGTAFSTSLYPLVVSRLGLGLGRCISESGERGSKKHAADSNAHDSTICLLVRCRAFHDTHTRRNARNQATV